MAFGPKPNIAQSDTDLGRQIDRCIGSVDVKVSCGYGAARRSLADVLELDLSSLAGPEVASDSALKELHHVGELQAAEKRKPVKSDGGDKDGM